MGIFDKRIAFKPFEYPEVTKYKDAINHSYWLVSEWNFISDVQDFKVKLSDVERNAIKNALLAISQIEISVKRFWTKLGDRFPKAEFEQVGVTYGECFVDGTEILTPAGWKDLKDIRVGDEVLQFHSDNSFSITDVKHKFDQRYEGKMIRFKKASTQSIVTPNHRMMLYNQKDEYIEVLAKDLITSNTCLKLPEAGKIRGGSKKSLTFMERLRVAIQAHGNRRLHNNSARKEYEICIRNPQKIERLDWILSNLEVGFDKEPLTSKKESYRYTIEIEDNYDCKNFEWVNLQDKSHEWCRDFKEELFFWDNLKLKTPKYHKNVFNTTSKEVADIAQMVGVAAGYRTKRTMKIDSGKETFRETYKVYFISNGERTKLSSLKSSEIDYEGFVRCVTVDSGSIVTRLGGKTFISGNSEVRHADAYSHLLEVLGLNDNFNLLLENEVIQGRIDYLTKYLKGASDNSNENFTLSLALFSIFIENVSLFSQFLVIKSFNKYMNILKDIDNVVQATMKEETLHALFGVYIIKQIKSEYPEWFNDDFYTKLQRACKKAYDAECKIIDWIFESGELSFMPKNQVKEFVKKRFNDSLDMVGCEKIFEIDEKLLQNLKWFDDEIYAEVNTDFFHKKSVNYSKKIQAINAEDLF